MKKLNKFSLLFFCLFSTLQSSNSFGQENDLDFGTEWIFERGSYNNKLFEHEVEQQFPTLVFSADFFTLSHPYISEVLGDNFTNINETNQTFELLGGPFILLGLSGYVSFLANHYGIYYTDENLDEARNPFSYSIEIFDGYKELTITNNQGDFAVYSSVNLSTPNIKNKWLSISPNPVQDFIHVKTKPNTILKSFQIFDVKGLLIKTNNFEDNSKINVNALEKGLYILKVVDEKDNQSITKFIKS